MAHVGIALSLVGTLGWAAYYLFVRMGIDSGRLTNAILVGMLCHVLLFVPAAIAINYPSFGLTWTATVVFVVAGVGSGLFGRLFQFVSTDRIGASRTSPVVASASLVSTLLAVVVLGESLTLPHFVGIGLIVVGVAVTSWDTARDPGGKRPLRDVVPSLVFPILAATVYGIEPIWVKIGLAEGTPYLVGMAVMIVSSFCGFFAYRVLYGAIPIRSVRDDPGLKWYVAAGVSGGFAFVTYFAALDVAPVVVVIPIFASAPILVVVLSALFMPRHLERVTWRVVGGAIAVAIGVVLVTLRA